MQAIRDEIRSLDPQTGDFRNFGWLVGGVFLLLGALFWWLGRSWYPVMLWIGGPLVVLGTVAPRLLRPIYWGWMSLAVVMGFVVTRVLLTIFFLLVIIPVGLTFKLIGRDPLHRKLDRRAASYWIPKTYAIDDRSRLEKYF
ncbi:MAG: LPXTG cell wall anchor domain-containing protein [Acidobacteria bacterium]|nr:MAG: LPXTG cell wall anchor domain-containing protein [Acidobacteriota bacterium]